MKFGWVVLASILAVIRWVGCSDKTSPVRQVPDDEKQVEFEGEVDSASSCKSNAYRVGSSVEVDSILKNQDCIEYSYNGTSVLQVKHINAALNCCPAVIAADFLLTDGVITIVELDSTVYGGCRCDCLFDIDYLLEGVSPGTYTIVVSEPLASPGIAFVADLTDSTSGIHCVERNYYPWEQ